MGNPMRILNAAIRSKELSQAARDVAVDMRAVAAIGGPDAFAQFIDQVPVATKAAEALADFFINNSGINHSDVVGEEGAAQVKIKNDVGTIVQQSLNGGE